MTQDSDRRPSTQRRSNRAGRSRPVLITPTSAAAQNGAEEIAVQDTIERDAPALSSSVNQQDMMTTAETQSPRQRMLPRFFSSVAKSPQPQSIDSKQARMARATHNKAPVTTKDGKASVSPQLKQAASSARPTPARSTSPFKMRHIIGILIYMLAAQFVGVALQAWFISQHIERVLVPTFKIPIFNFPVTITTSTAVFLIILVVLLIVLARLDLVPTSFSSASQRGRNTPTSRRQDPESSRDTLPNTRQGIQGSNDDLYQEYQDLQRYRRRRERKK
ncbi:MAG: hypothetical protein M3Z08_23010 [Chloroflexota bacterium]|nr:hypothetical protein [Chloroflexota bacterium]